MQAEKELMAALRAGYSFFYTQTFEIQRSIQTIKDLIETFNKEGKQQFNTITFNFEESPDPEEFFDKLDNAEAYTIGIGQNINWFFKDDYGAINKAMIQMLQNRSEIWTTQDNRKALIVVSDSAFSEAIPAALQRDFLSLDFSLPDKQEIEKIYESIIEAVKDNPAFTHPTKKDKKKILDSSRGLTKRELQNALAFSLIKDGGTIKPATLAEIQAKEVEKTAGLKIGRYTETFESLKGYDNIKRFALATFSSPYSLGIMLLGPPGTGKSHFCKAMAGQTGQKILTAEMAELFGGLVGESERLMKTFIDIVKANAPCILFIDEIEKALAGMKGGQTGDGGTTKRSMAQFLKFLSDERPEGLYVIATCNDISSLPPEWIRAERWDCAPFFIDLPNKEERKEILKHYQKVYKVKGEPKDMAGWSGAEIKSACRIAAMMNTSVDKVVDFVVPVSKTMESEIASLRKWSEGKTIPASTTIKNGGKRAVDI